MTLDQQRRVRDLFEAALDRDEPDARNWLASEAADDPVVRDEVLSLLAHHSQAGAFLVESIVDSVPILMADDEPLAAKTVVGNYTIVRELGRGGMGRVYLASDSRLGRMVALKALAPHYVSDPRQRERLRREARAAAALTHPGICTVYALEEIDGELYIASEYVDGRTLREEIRSGVPPSPADVLRTARDLAAALASAHARGVVHRDLKPENIMRTASGALKILDFGLARFDEPRPGAASGASAESISRTGMVFGTPGYMAPEQILGGRVDARADVFAFGVLMNEHARAIQVGPELTDIIARCLQKAPADRYASGSELFEALGRCDVPTSPPPASDTTWWRIHQLSVFAAYVLATVLGWQIKELHQTPLTVAAFLTLGAASTIGGVLRGHVMFTEKVNRRRLARERRRTAPGIRLLDLAIAVLLIGDAILVLGTTALGAAIALSLGLGIAAASIVMEPSTTAAAFENEHES